MLDPAPLLAFYGDDFTGSTDCLECLERAGVRAALFLDVPAASDLERFDGLRAFGVAGNTRSLPTAELAAELAPVLEGFATIGARFVHYKVCSTFDSSPEVGSIGRVIDLALETFAAPIALLVGAPALGRYCVFGNLFARAGLDSEPFRLDRHPAMRHHPITPMAESDLRLCLGAQTRRSVALLDILHVASGAGAALAAYEALLRDGPEVVLLDVLLEEHLPALGRILWDRERGGAATFAVGSSGVEMALGAWWRECGLAAAREVFPAPGPAAPVLAVSGSCSSVTAKQIAAARACGYHEVALDTPALVRGAAAANDAAMKALVEPLRAGRHVVAHVGLGPDDPRIEAARQALAGAARGEDAGTRNARSGHDVGVALGRLARRVLEVVRPPRVVVAGGDTAGRVARELGIAALAMVAPAAPGSPFCRAHAPGSPADGLEFLFKGGQVGKRDFFESAARGVFP